MKSCYYLIWVSLVGIIIFSGHALAICHRRRRISAPEEAPPGLLLESKNVQEIGCLPWKAVFGFNNTLINSPTGCWYVPCAGKHFYYYWAEQLINRSISEPELPKLCLKFIFTVVRGGHGGHYAIAIAYYSGMQYFCKDTAGFENECRFTGMAAKSKKVEYVWTIVATDNQNWILIARCLPNKVRDWAVLVKDTFTFDPSLFKDIENKIETHVFDIQNTERPKYDTCSL